MTASPGFGALQSRLLVELRNSAKPKALHAIVDVIEGKDSAGERKDDGSAAWAAARTKAASAVLGNEIGPSRPGVNIQVNQFAGGQSAGFVRTVDDCIREDEARAEREKRGEVPRSWEGPPVAGYILKPSERMVEREKARRAQQQGHVVGGPVIDGKTGDGKDL